MARLPCPRCGYENPRRAVACDVCQGVLGGDGSRSPASGSPGRRNFYSEQVANRRDSWLLMAAFVVVFLLAAGAIGEVTGIGPAGIVLGLGFGIAGAASAYFAGDRMVLAASGAVEATAAQEPVLFNVVEELCLASGLPRPRLYVIESAALNAFATGRDGRHASVAVTRGLLNAMDREELQGVLGHEMSHIRNLDVRFATVVAVLVGAVALLSDGYFRGARLRAGRRPAGGRGALVVVLALGIALFAPLASRLIQMAISRRRELLADASGVELTRNPRGLASALRKIARDPSVLEAANRATQHLYIVNPLASRRMDAPALFSTHPPIETRIRILEAMA